MNYINDVILVFKSNMEGELLPLPLIKYIT